MDHASEPPQKPQGSPHLKAPPFSLEAEQSVIGGIFLKPAAFDLVADLAVDDFHRPAHRIIWGVVREQMSPDSAFRDISDNLTIKNELADKGLLEKAGGAEYLVEITEATPGPSNVRAYAAIVKEKARQRRVITTANDIADAAFANDDPGIATGIRKLVTVNATTTGKTKMTDETPEGIEWIWDRWLPKAALVMLAAPGGSGKGTFWSYIVACATNRHPWPNGFVSEPMDVAVFSPEDDRRRELVPRLKLAGVDADRVHLCDTADIALASTECGMVILDPIAQAFAGDGNSAADVRPYIERFANHASQTGQIIIGVHHVGKYAASRKGAAARDLPIGSTAWVDVCRWLLMLARDRSDETGSRLLIRAKGNLGGVDFAQGAWRIHAEDGSLGNDEQGRPIRNKYVSRVEYVEGDADELFFDALESPHKNEESTEQNDTAQTILEVLESLGGRALRGPLVEACRQAGVSARSFDTWIKRLHERKKLIWRKAGIEELPKDAKYSMIAVLLSVADDAERTF